MSILACIATCPHPKIILGPVDLTCSFIVVDIHWFDWPIVYASPSFYQLTGYEDHEVIGRNCWFLQSPNRNVRKGEERQYVTPETVRHLCKAVVLDKECQVSIINYQKGGQAFINLVTIIPIPGVFTIHWRRWTNLFIMSVFKLIWQNSLMLFWDNYGMGVTLLIMALGLLPFCLCLRLLHVNTKLSYQRISKPSSQILFSSIRYPSLWVQ